MHLNNLPDHPSLPSGLSSLLALSVCASLTACSPGPEMTPGSSHFPPRQLQPKADAPLPDQNKPAAQGNGAEPAGNADQAGQADPTNPADSEEQSDQGSGSFAPAAKGPETDNLRAYFERYAHAISQGRMLDAIRFSGHAVANHGPVLVPQSPDEKLDPSVLDEYPNLPSTTDPRKTLMITDPRVVADPTRTYDPCDLDATSNHRNPDAVWSFKSLMSQMAQGQGISTQEFIHYWLLGWMQDQEVNWHTVPRRTGVMDYFPGWDAENPHTLDVDRLPFRLLAIVNRLDLTKMDEHGFQSPGETRLVFGLLDLHQCAPANRAERATVIFEYGDVIDSCEGIEARAHRWLALDRLPLGSPRYLEQLESITNEVTQAFAAPSKPNKSALNQLRTNDFGFDPGIDPAPPSGSPPNSTMRWELREFRLFGDSSVLIHNPIHLTPDEQFQRGSEVLAQYLHENADEVLCEAHQVPRSYANQHFLGGAIAYDPGSFWDTPLDTWQLPHNFSADCPPSQGIQDSSLSLDEKLVSEVRHKFSLNTCNGCHSGETSMFFVHVDPSTRELSRFLTGGTFDDPVHGSQVQREFNDLARRGQLLESFATRGCNGGHVHDSGVMQAPSSSH